MQKKEMADTKAIRQATAQEAVQAAKASVLAINGEGRRKSINIKYSGALDTEQDPP